MRVVNDNVGGAPVVVLWQRGTASALDAGRIASGRDVGAATTFSHELDGQTLTFTFDDDRQHQPLLVLVGRLQAGHARLQRRPGHLLIAAPPKVPGTLEVPGTCYGSLSRLTPCPPAV